MPAGGTVAGDAVAGDAVAGDAVAGDAVAGAGETAGGRPADGPGAEAPLGIVSAIPEEIAHFGGGFQEDAVETLAGFRFRRGRLDGRAVVLVETGIGKVNAATVTTLLAQVFRVRALLFSGVAGGLDPSLGIGDLVVATELIQHDYGALIGERIRPYRPGVPPLPGFESVIAYPADPRLVERARAALAGLVLPALSGAATGGTPRLPAIHYGVILTGDSFVNCEATRRRLHQDFAGRAVEMEGAAVAQVAERFGLPVLVVRALSDLAGAESHVDFGSFLSETAAGAALVVRRLAEVL